MRCSSQAAVFASDPDSCSGARLSFSVPLTRSSPFPAPVKPHAALILLVSDPLNSRTASGLCDAGVYSCSNDLMKKKLITRNDLIVQSSRKAMASSASGVRRAQEERSQVPSRELLTRQSRSRDPHYCRTRLHN